MSEDSPTFDPILDEAERHFRREIVRIVARQAKDRNFSSRSIIAVLDQLERSSYSALEICLRAVGNKSQHPGRQRNKLLIELHAAMAQYFDRSEGVALDQVYKRGMSEEHPMVVDSFAISRSKSADEIERWKTGFAGPNQRWHQRHPVVLIVISAAVGALLGEAVRQLSTLI